MRRKEELREKYLNIRSGFEDERVLLSSKQISDRFLSLNIVTNSKSFLLYHSFRKEIITHGIIDHLLKEDKRVYLPYISKDKDRLEIGRIYDQDNFKTGVFGIKEPEERSNIPVTEMDVIVVPGLTFAKNGYRIGYGGGYYDKLLALTDSNNVAIGLAYDCFLHEMLPVDDFDIPVDIIVTEKQILFIGGEQD